MFQESALIFVADWHWRKGPPWKAALAWLFGQRERFTTLKGDRAVISWFGGTPYLVSLEGAS